MRSLVLQSVRLSSTLPSLLLSCSEPSEPGAFRLHLLCVRWWADSRREEGKVRSQTQQANTVHPCSCRSYSAGCLKRRCLSAVSVSRKVMKHLRHCGDCDSWAEEWRAQKVGSSEFSGAFHSEVGLSGGTVSLVRPGVVWV